MKLLQTLGVICYALSAGAALASDCETVASSVAKQVDAAPEKVLMIVEDAMAQHEKCACELVKAAIVASQANEKLVGEIVFTAVIASESMAPTVAECAISVAPDSASQIRSALKRALSDAGSYSYTDGGKSPVSGKDVIYDKEPIPSAEPVDDSGFSFGRAPLDVRGIYLLAPSPGGGGITEVVEFKKIVKTIYREKKGSGSSGGGHPVTPSDPKPKNHEK